MAKRTAQQHVDSVLRYLSKMERLAEQLHDRNGAGDYGHSWRVVMQRFYGRYRPVTFPRFHTARVAESSPKPKTSEQLVVAKAPLRKVLRRVPTFWRTPDRRHRHVMWTEHLECGHKVDAIFYARGERRARHRKCRDCVPPNKARVLKFLREVAI